MIWLVFPALFVVRCGCQITGDGWPKGSYGLPKPKSGCPSGKNNGWYEGWRYQDMEDEAKNKRSSISTWSHMDVTLVGNKKDVNRTFCMKQNTGTQMSKDWPKGSYCIYKRGACPKSMISGWIRWDDSNYDNNNRNDGFLPDGSYDSNTKIEYCCQTEGHWYDVIELPVSRPFYLLTSSSNNSPKCQMIKWAFSYLEYIEFDTEDDDNNDGQGGEHAFKDKDTLYYCYYENCKTSMTGPSGSLELHTAVASEMDPRSQYCSWLITIAESYVVSLSFEELIIPSCDDTFLKIYDGSNDTAPLLGTYCGSNASAELVDISSSTNSLFIVSNSGSYEGNSKSIFRFKAQYNAEHSTGCRHNVTGNTGYMKSPKFDTPSNYPDPSHPYCSWLVTVDDAYLVTLNFSYLELLDNAVINIYDGDNENARLLAHYPSLNATRNIVKSSSNIVFIMLKYNGSSSYKSMFAFHYASQPKPTEIIKIVQTTSTSVISTVSTQEPNRESPNQNENNQTTYIIVAVVVGVAVVLILIAILIFLRRKKKKAASSSSLHSINPSYSLRKKASASDDDPVYYANPSTPQEKVWVGNSRVCKESRNPLYQATTEGSESPALYASPDNTCEPLVKNEGHSAQSENPLYGGGEVVISHVYAEPSNSPPQNVVYDEPDVKI